MNWHFVNLDTVDSTNNFIRTIDKDRVVVVSDYQSSGRGQGDNFWESEEGKNLLFSLKLKDITISPNRQFLLSMVGALALKDTLDTYAKGFKFKWPNDIYWGDKKVSGTLIETVINQRNIKECIYGVGVNVNQKIFHSSAPNPISLCQIINKEIDGDELLKLFLINFDNYNSMIIQNENEIINAYNAILYRKNGFYKYKDKAGLFEAEIVEVKPNGLLVLRDKEGMKRTYELKEVKFII